MIRKEKDGIKWLEFALLQQYPEVVHGVFLRSGGISEDCYHSLNLGGGSGDSPSKVQSNRNKVQAVLKLSSLISCHQVHGDAIKNITELKENDKCDGMITREKDVGLMIKHADCQAAIFYDPKHKAIANVHSGWRGNVQNIYAKATQKMQEEFGSITEDIIVCISPSLGPERSEFISFETEFPADLWAFQHKPCYFDLWEMSRFQLEEAGILRQHIEVACICTYDHSSDFFSYRRDKITGRNATIVALR